MEKMKYTATDKKGRYFVTVLSSNLKEAIVLIRQQLSQNRGRLPFLKKWEKDGQLVITPDGHTVFSD